MRLFLAVFFLIWNSAFSQQTEYVDFITGKAHISFGDLTKKEVSGTIVYQF